MTSSALAVTQYWSFVQSASSQAQLTATLAGISITAMVLVLSPLFLGPRMSSLGATRQSEIRDLFKFLLISFTTLITASMLWGQLNGYSEVEGLVWQDLSKPEPTAEMAPLHVLFLACASLTTMGVIALSVVLLELVLLSSAEPSHLTRLVLAMYAVIVSMASLQVLFGIALVVADLRGSGVSDQEALDHSMWAVPVVLVSGAMPAIRSWLRRRTHPWSTKPAVQDAGKSALRRAETVSLWMAGGLSVLAVQLAPELSTDAHGYSRYLSGDVLAILGGFATLGYACLMWWALWGVTDRLSAAAFVGDPEPALPDLVDSLGLSAQFAQPARVTGNDVAAPVLQGSIELESLRPRRPVLRNARKPTRPRHRRHSHGRAPHPMPPRN